MKDHPWHGSFPILAGMFGLKCGIVKNIADKLNNFQINEQYHYDQIFINNEIYPFIKNDCVIHDEIFEKKPFPTKRDTMRFVGERIGVDELPVNNDWKSLIQRI